MKVVVIEAAWASADRFFSFCQGNSFMSRLASIFMDHDGYLVDKWESYIGIYESELAGFVQANEPITLLEIGVQNGGSLQVWRKYLPVGSRIVGVDINPDCATLSLDENTTIHIADGTEKDALATALGDLMFDVIIDDGSHRSAHIISTFQALYSRVRGGGKYFVEDLHASYWPEYGGGFRTPGSAMEYLKSLVDGLNCDHFRDTGTTPRADVDFLRDLGRSIARTTFYDSVAVIEFMNVPRDMPYRQLFSGGEALVMPLSTLMLAGGRPPADTRLVGRTAARHINQVLVGRITELTEALAQGANAGSAGRQQFVSIDSEQEALRHDLAILRSELTALKASTSWRMTLPVRKLGRLFGRS